MNATRLTNKQLLVLTILRDHPEGLTAKEIGKKATKRTPCSVCNGTGEGDDPRVGCRPCWGGGTVFFPYGVAYQALQRLRVTGHVDRRHRRDEWGDELPRHVYFSVASGEIADPLEVLYSLPSAEGPPDDR